jgi:hypothetical protein
LSSLPPPNQHPNPRGGAPPAAAAAFKVPSFWELRDDLPLTASHRVEKAKLLSEGR